MVQLADVGGSAGVTKTFDELKLDRRVTKDIVQLLEENADQLREGHFQRRDVDTAWFGPCATGQYVGLHTGLAHRALANSILEAVAALQDIKRGINKFEREIDDIDANSAALSQALIKRTERAVESIDHNPHTHRAGHKKGHTS